MNIRVDAYQMPVKRIRRFIFYRFTPHMSGSAVLETVKMSVRTDIAWIYCASISNSILFIDSTTVSLQGEELGVEVVGLRRSYGRKHLSRSTRVWKNLSLRKRVGRAFPKIKPRLHSASNSNNLDLHGFNLVLV